MLIKRYENNWNSIRDRLHHSSFTIILSYQDSFIQASSLPHSCSSMNSITTSCFQFSTELGNKIYQSLIVLKLCTISILVLYILV